MILNWVRTEGNIQLGISRYTPQYILSCPVSYFCEWVGQTNEPRLWQSFFVARCPFPSSGFLLCRAQHGAKSALVYASWGRVFRGLFLAFVVGGFCFSAGFCLAPCCRFLSFLLGTKWVMGSWRVQIAAASRGVFFFCFWVALGWYPCGCTRCACVVMSTLHFQIISD